MSTVLLIEDDDDLRGVLAGILRARGYKVTEHANGNKGVESMREETPDLIITDIMMDGGDGIETLLAARNVAARVPVIVMSGNELFLEQSKRLGAAAALLKPFRGAALLKSVEAVLAGSPAGATSVLI